ncbi:hypothetical protein FRB95_010092 [Tulasnella sp. JGI-2019a]|nr:hypothetical protein FRB95_010092 [Tulasnella sp. JGI-2019a]
MNARFISRSRRVHMETLICVPAAFGAAASGAVGSASCVELATLSLSSQTNHLTKMSGPSFQQAIVAGHYRDDEMSVNACDSDDDESMAAYQCDDDDDGTTTCDDDDGSIAWDDKDVFARPGDEAKLAMFLLVIQLSNGMKWVGQWILENGGGFPGKAHRCRDKTTQTAGAAPVFTEIALRGITHTGRKVLYKIALPREVSDDPLVLLSATELPGKQPFEEMLNDLYAGSGVKAPDLDTFMFDLVGDLVKMVRSNDYRICT